MIHARSDRADKLFSAINCAATRSMRANMGQVNITIPEQRVRDFCERWKIAELSLFGSVLREDFGPDSDVDVLVTFSKDAQWSLYEWVEMIAEVPDIFGRGIHSVATKSSGPVRRCMQPESKDGAYLWDMLDAARAIREFVSSRSFVSADSGGPSGPSRSR